MIVSDGGKAASTSWLIVSILAVGVVSAYPHLRKFEQKVPYLDPKEESNERKLFVENSSSLPSASDMIHSFYELQSESKCNDWGDLFSNSGFEVVDPFGSNPITDRDVVISGCKAASETFSKVDLSVTKVFPLADESAAAASFHVASITKKQCKLNFDGVDTFEFDSNRKIKKLVGWFNTTIPGSQFDCVDNQDSFSWFGIFKHFLKSKVLKWR
eukprot:g3246.t1